MHSNAELHKKDDVQFSLTISFGFRRFIRR